YSRAPPALPSFPTRRSSDLPRRGDLRPEPGERHEGAAAGHAVSAGLQLPRAGAREHPAGPGLAAGCAQPGGEPGERRPGGTGVAMAVRGANVRRVVTSDHVVGWAFA